MAGAEDFDSGENGSAGERAQPPEDLLSRALDAFTLPTRGDGTIPALPPAMAAMHGKSAPEILADLNKTPLFMTELEENDELEAFKSLAYEGTPAEVALNFKERGNECFKEKHWADAKEFYTKGIQVLQIEQRKRATEMRSVDTENPEEHEELQILEASLVNRAACHLSLQNYRSCTLDCAAVLKLNPRSVKAYYRSAKALLALSKIPEANDVCVRGRAIDPSNSALKAVAEQIVAKSNEVQAKKKKELEREQEKRNEEKLLKAALKSRGIKMRKTSQPPEMEDAKVHLVLHPDDSTSELVFPTILLYPLHLQSDFLKDFAETETLGLRLAQVLAEPAPWDTNKEYTLQRVECYMETLGGGLIKVGKNITLSKALGGGNVEVVDDVVKMFVVPKAKAEAWIKDHKAKKAAEKGNG